MASLQETLGAMAAAAQMGDWKGAAATADEAIKRGEAHPSLYNTRAVWAENEERHQDALDDYLRALPYAPTHPLLLTAIGLCLVRVNRARDALSYLERAIAQAPERADAYFHTGWAHEALDDKEEAKAAYRQALERDPGHTQTLGALAMMEARGGNIEAAEPLARRALAAAPNDDWSILAMATIQVGKGEFASAEKTLRAFLGDTKRQQARARALSLLGAALEGLGRTGEAFDAFTAKGQFLHDINAERLADRRASKVLRGHIEQLKTMDAERWGRTELKPGSEAPKEHVFLLGFVRSGTTLLERVLLSDPDVVHVEERDTLGDAVAQYMGDAKGLDRLANAPPAALEFVRSAYWQRVRNFGVAPEGKVVIDKQPLATLYLPIIWRLFPDAKILFAIRDPRDVVLSTLRRDFEVNATTFEFQRLDDIARYYAAVMDWAALCRERIAFDLHQHRYEDMIGDFETAIRGVCAFLGIAWREDMRDFNTVARADTIRSHSEAQVRQPLNREGLEQWRRYAAQMAPVQPILAPWVSRFGYPKD